ncbi:HNH endonuclease signature motif containing protein [Nostoc sp. NMS9]|uniref:HNH endonuclease n=1 Tax=Nostoc sp. NMS9 TaxID=2815393 RepID=UPI0025E824F3|nr:HNH endonuclease signature motif containing protein [Nostoc sp. NMS9]MBN3944280.1 HNH endonuclease [Nostoc sp. NMS9]
MSTIGASLRQLVIQRASDRCEYCCLSQAGQEATFHIDHVTPVVAGGKTTADNLALACVSCSLHKSHREIQHGFTSKIAIALYYQTFYIHNSQSFSK